MSAAHAARSEFQSAARQSDRAFALESQPGVHLQPGTAVFIEHEGEIGTNGLAHVLASSWRLAKRMLFVTTRVELVPSVPDAQRVDLVALSEGIFLVALHNGFNDEPDIPRLLSGIEGLDLDVATTRYYVTDDRVAHAWIRNMPAWQRWIFAMMSRACVSAVEYFRLPADRTTQMPTGERIPRRSAPP
jgi:KUP system potassium uptake protein